MAVKQTQNAYMMNRKVLTVDGHEVQMAAGGLGFEPNAVEVSRAVYGSVDAVHIMTYTGGAQSFDLLDDANLNTTRKILAGFDPSTTGAVETGRKRTPRPLLAIVNTLDEDGTGYDDGSEFLANWRARFGAARGDPDAIAVRTIQGNADLPKTLENGYQYLFKRCALTSTGSGQIGTWATPTPQELADFGAGFYAAYLEIQTGSGRTFKQAELAVDATNVTLSSNGGGILIPHADVINAGIEPAQYAYVVIAHAATGTKVAHDSRYGAT
jgi:hypothetical protein